MNIKIFYLVPIFEIYPLSISLSKEYANSPSDVFSINLPVTNLFYTKNNLQDPIQSLPNVQYSSYSRKSIESFALDYINSCLNLSFQLDQISIFKTQFNQPTNELFVFILIPKQKSSFGQHLEQIQINENLSNPLFSHFVFSNLINDKFSHDVVCSTVQDFINSENFKNFHIQSAFLSSIEKSIICAFLKQQGYFSPEFNTELKIGQSFAPNFKKFS